MSGFEGYAAVFGVVDRAGEVIAPGAFGRAFGDRHPVPLLWQHRGQPVGVIERIGEDARGLRVAGRIEDAGVAALVRAGALSGLSVGYRARSVARAARRTILSAELIEVSLVAVPMQRLARVDRMDSTWGDEE